MLDFYHRLMSANQEGSWAGNGWDIWGHGRSRVIYFFSGMVYSAANQAMAIVKD